MTAFASDYMQEGQDCRMAQTYLNLLAAREVILQCVTSGPIAQDNNMYMDMDDQ